MLTIKEIAALANVSRTTVSRALNNSGYVSEDARKRIMKVIEETGYVPSEHAKSLRTKKTKVIGVILPKISTETASRVVNGIDAELSQNGYQILLANTDLEREKEINYLRLLKSRQVDGVILLATNVNDTLLTEIQQLHLPFVVLGQEFPAIDSVVYDDYHAAFDVTELMIAKGHKRIGFIGVDESDRAVGVERKRGFLDALSKHHLPIGDPWIQKGVFDISSGYDAMKMMMEQDEERPTAVFAVTDRLAIGAMTYLKEQGFKLPGEMALAGIGASELSQFVEPTLTTVDYFNEEAGHKAAQLILNKIATNRKSVEKITLGYGLIKRDSL